MKTEYLRVSMDLSIGSAYKYDKESDIPTKIEYGRYHSGKFQKGVINGYFSNKKLHDIIFLIKRGCELTEIEERTKMVY